MNWVIITCLIIVTVPVLLVIYDILAYAFGTNNATISFTLLSVSLQYRGFVVCVTFASGVFFGHVFLPQHTDQLIYLPIIQP